MKLVDLWKTSQKPTLSFELFPARNPKAAERLGKAIDTLTDLEPDFVSVTFGAGGSTREGSYQLINKLIKEKGLDVLGYFAGFGLSPDEVASVLDSYDGLGMENILIVRGDEPREIENWEPHPDSFQYASDLMAFVKPRYGFCFGCAGYPESHIEAASKSADMEYLKLKVDNGAEYIITNYAYDNRFFFDFVERCGAAGINVPILPGIMPVYSVKMMNMLASLCGATITDKLQNGIDSLPENDIQALHQFGIDFAVEQCTELIQSGIVGLHIYTMDRSSSAVGIVNRLRDLGLL
jgi:methylenetetrahydrofolate reductase (NADPH)